MKINKGYIAVGLIIAFALFFELVAHADEFDQSTTITFSEPIQIPGQVLPAGTYLFKLANSNSDRNIVQIFSSDRTHLYATFLAIPTERQTSTDDTSMTFAEKGAGNPEALLNWFYPGRLTGHALVYPREQEKELAKDRQRIVVANQQPTSNSEPAGIGN